MGCSLGGVRPEFVRTKGRLELLVVRPSGIRGELEVGRPLRSRLLRCSGFCTFSGSSKKTATVTIDLERAL